MPGRFHRLLLALASGSLLLASGCGSSNSDNTGTDADCSLTGRNQQIIDLFRSWYYWYPSVPANLSSSAYSDPADLVSAIRQQQAADRFSFVITHTASQAFFGAGQYVGYGFAFRFTANNELELTRVFAGSAADKGGLARGDRITTIDGVSVASLAASGQLGTALNADVAGHTIAVGYVDTSGASRQTSLSAGTVTRPNVDQVSVLTAGNRRVGYFFFDSFIDLSNAQLDAAFARFAASSVDDLVIDERYNGGGELSVAQHLASLIAGNDYIGQRVVRLTFNDKHSDSNQSVPFERVSSPLNLKRVFFITTGGSASASEVMINALRPYIEVVTVGDTTFGKPVGENIFTICDYDIFPITFKLENASGFGDYFDGFTPTCPADDDVTRALGDPEEASLASALHFARTGSCGSGHAASAAGRGTPIRRAAHPTYGWRELLGAY
jgi:carboxyl-terminal processing protease